MKKLKNSLGFTLAELLIVVAIIVVLAAVSFIGVQTYQRSMGQVERDGIAKEIFVAAQNHLTVAHGEGYLGTTAFGEAETDENGKATGVYYFVVDGSIPGNSVLGQMLPFGAVDETVRNGGSYIIRYQKDTGLVLDVFYCTKTASPAQFNHPLSSGDYSTVLGLRDTDTENHKQDRRNWNGNILGWYGGASGVALPTVTLNAPTIKVVNGDRLYVEVTNPNMGVADSNGNSVDTGLRLIITGLSSGVEHYYNLPVNVALSTVVLDDITSRDTHFCNRSFDDMESGTTNNGFIPGENISIQAVAFSTDALSNTEHSVKKTANSLFEDGTTATTAFITSIRHLENLDRRISDLGANDSAGSLNIASAVQTSNLSWTAFNGNADLASGQIYLYSSSTAATDAGYYYPIEPDYALSYDGQNHNVSGIRAKGENAGLFGAATKLSAISNLELIDFSVTGTATAGALAGALTDCTVTNVLARNSTNAAAVNIQAPTAGGLIGSVSKSEHDSVVQYSGATVIVSGSATAGGLVGSAEATPIFGCFSGGHTANGSYQTWVGMTGNSYDVTGGKVGGLVGSTNATISRSYSTCSVSGVTAGGLAGSVSGAVTGCYAAGLVQGTSKQYALIGDGDLPAGSAENYYYRVINEVPAEKAGETEPMLPVSGYTLNTENMAKVKPLDLNADSYNDFTGAYSTWHSARAFDSPLVRYYGEKYCLRTVAELVGTLPPSYFVNTHYGDWPSPEVFFINTSS